MPTGERFCLFDTRSADGSYIELMEISPAMEESLARMHRAHLSWDGHTDPVRGMDALAAYGLRPDSGRELIHLVPLSLGGTNDKENLWPLPNSREFGPAQKKALDEALQKKVCDGSIELKTAQDALKKNWMDAYKKYVGQ